MVGEVGQPLPAKSGLEAEARLLGAPGRHAPPEDDDEDIEAALKALRQLRDEVTARGKLLEELGDGATKVTRELALKDPRMRPKVVVFDECHELFMHKEYGKEAAELAIKVMKKARKTAITLVWVTVSPTADSLPRDVTRNTSHRVAFAVGDVGAVDVPRDRAVRDVARVVICGAIAVDHELTEWRHGGEPGDGGYICCTIRRGADGANTANIIF